MDACCRWRTLRRMVRKSKTETSHCVPYASKNILRQSFHLSLCQSRECSTLESELGHVLELTQAHENYTPQREWGWSSNCWFPYRWDRHKCNCLLRPFGPMPWCIWTLTHLSSRAWWTQWICSLRHAFSQANPTTHDLRLWKKLVSVRMALQSTASTVRRLTGNSDCEGMGSGSRGAWGSWASWRKVEWGLVTVFKLAFWANKIT